jgi:chromosome segregation ATPase
MTMEQELVKAKDDLALAKDQAGKAEKASTDMNAQIKDLKSENERLAKENGELKAENLKLKSDVAARDGQIKDLNAKVEATEKSVDQKAGAKAAASLRKIGIKPVTEASDPNAGTSAAELWEQYAQITDGAEKRKFYLAHKDQM